MADIYTSAWYESLKQTLNASDEVTKNAPRGVWHVLAEIKGDASSPYVPDGQTKRFSIVLNDGRCERYEELSEAPPRKDFEFILELPATLFEHVVADLADPVEAGLKGGIRITGDMRVLIQNAELVNLLSEVYQREIETAWPNGRPPYAATSSAGAAGRGEGANS